MVTVRTNPATKKVIPLSQLQVLNSKGGIKVLPLGGKIVGKTVTTSTNTVSSSPVYIMNPKIQNSAPITINAPIPTIQNPLINMNKPDNGNLPPVVVIANEQVVAPHSVETINKSQDIECTNINKDDEFINNPEIEIKETDNNLVDNEKESIPNLDEVNGGADVPSEDEEQVLNKFQSNCTDVDNKSKQENAFLLILIF